MLQEKPDIITGVLWWEKYRPTQLKDVALEADTRGVLQAFLTAGEIPHLLLVGPPGSGKTTVARIIYNTLDCRHLTLNASSERGIDTVRAKIGTFITGMGARWNVVFLDEADALTVDAQEALRNMIESHADHARFILTANKGHKVIGPIQSRCQTLIMPPPPFKERARILVDVLKAEGIKVDAAVVLGYAEKYGDMRKLLQHTQRAYLGKGKGQNLPPADTVVDVVGEELLEHILAKDYGSLRKVTASGGFDAQQVLRDLFYAVPDDHDKAGFLRHTFGRGLHETGFTPDPVVLFLAVCAEAMEGM